MRYAILLAFPLTLSGCVGPKLTSPTFSAKGSTKNLATNDGSSWETAQDIPATNIDAGVEGLMQQSGGPHRTLTLAINDAVFTLTDPLDGTLEGFRATMADGTSIELDGFESKPSVTIEAYNEQVVAALETQAKITAEQAAVARQALQTGATLAEAIMAALGG